MLIKPAEHRALLAAVIAGHLILGAWLLGGPTTREATVESQITVSLLAAPQAAPAEPTLPAIPKATPPVRNPKMQTAPRTSPAALAMPTPMPRTAPAATAATAATAAPAATSAPAATAATAAPMAAAAPVAIGESRPGNAPVAETRSDAFTQARFDADYLQNPAPAYPPLSRRLREEGRVMLRVSVTPQGHAESVEIKNSSGSERLDQAALRTVRQWKFVPARRGDAAVQSWVLVPVQFKLEQ